MSTPAPTRLPANQPPQFYRGGAAIAEFRGARAEDTYGPEDWVASTTTMFGQDTKGLSVLPDGRSLRDAVVADPVAWLGSEHVAAFGSSTGLLVKLLHAGQRLPVHCHPDDAFARQHFSSGCGKTEAWVVVGTAGRTGTVYIGFREDQTAETVAGWVAGQDGEAMLDALNAVEVSAGDTVFVPAGVPHAIGAGVFVVELQQPTDLSITLEWRNFLAGPENGHLGIGYETALRCVDRSGWDARRVASVRKSSSNDAVREDALVPQADPFFRAEWLSCGTGGRSVSLRPSFGVLVALHGAALLRPDTAEPMRIARGDTVVIPHSAGSTTVDGELTAVYCAPPEPDPPGHDGAGA